MSPGPRSISIPSGTLIHPAVLTQKTWAENWGEMCPFWDGGVRELGPNLTQCGWGRGLPPCKVSSWSIQVFGNNTPTSQTDNGPIAPGEPFYKPSPKKWYVLQLPCRPCNFRWNRYSSCDNKQISIDFASSAWKCLFTPRSIFGDLNP